MKLESNLATAARASRAAMHRSLGDERRLAIVDTLHHCDRSVGELAQLTGLATNLLAFHLQVLDDAEVIERTTSEGDGRRRYVSLQAQALDLLGAPPPLAFQPSSVLFVCTANSARSQLAAHLWRSCTGHRALSAGTEPAAAVDPRAIATARRHGLDLSSAEPRAFDDLDGPVDLVVSVCDRAHEHGVAASLPRLHWSLPDPVPAGTSAFEHVFARLRGRVERLAYAAEAA